MKVAVLTESSADDAAVRVLVRAALGDETEFHDPPLAARGYEAVVANLPSIYKWLHFQRHAEALVVVVDSDQSPLDDSDPKSRKRLLTERLTQLESEVSPKEGFPPIQTAVGIAVPSIESWLLFGKDPQCTEAAWKVSLQARKSSFNEIQRLKKLLYRTVRPPLAMVKEQMTQAAADLIHDGKLNAMEKSFPWGFQSLMTSLRGWRPDNPVT